MADQPPLPVRPASPRRRITFARWLTELGESIPLVALPAKTGLSREQVLRLVRGGVLPVHRFTAADGRVFRMVRMVDVRAAQRAGEGLAPGRRITWEGMVRAFRAMAGEAS